MQKKKKKDLKIAGSTDHPINYDEHRQKKKGSKIYNKGKGSDNPYEKEMFLKRAPGPRLPRVKRQTKKKSYG